MALISLLIVILPVIAGVLLFDGTLFRLIAVALSGNFAVTDDLSVLAQADLVGGGIGF